MSSRISKTELLKKINDLSSLSDKELSKLPFNIHELSYLKKKIINDQLGFTFNFYEKDEDLMNNYFTLEEVENLHINPKETNNNLIIEGDNYYGLKALKIANIKVDVIYIDPPYNTGNKDFIYNDDFVNRDDENKHSKWLSFMKKRLELAKELLAEDGVIFVSIDDNEQAYLKILMDQIFGEENFISTMARETKTGGGRFGKQYIQKDYDYLIIYSKNLSICKEFNKLKTNWDDYKHIDERGNYSLKHPLDGGAGNKMYTNPVFINKNIYKPRPGKNWSFSEKRINFMIKNDFITPNSKGILYIKNYKDFEIIEINGEYEIIKKENGVQWSSSKFMDKVYNNSSGKRDLNFLNIFNFNYPKPINLIKSIISMINKQNIFILDFFAGSGTTAQAVMELNQEDGGNRRFILVTNNENNIATDVCRERVYRVINGVGSKNEKIDWVYSDEISSLNNNHVKYLKVKYIHKVDGEYEEINECKEIYKKEFNKDISIKDFIDN